jgi:hypothetical protein
MSGGHLEYIEWKILEIARQIRDDMLHNEIAKANDEKVNEKEFMYQHKLLDDTLRYAFIAHSYEWAASGDTSFDDFMEDYNNANSQNPEFRQKYKEYLINDIEQLYKIERDWSIHYTKEIIPSSWEETGNGSKRLIYGRYEEYYYNSELKHWNSHRYKIEGKNLKTIIEYKNQSVEKSDIPLKEVKIELAWD